MMNFQSLKSLGCVTLMLFAQSCRAPSADFVSARHETHPGVETNRITEYQKVRPQALAGDSGAQLAAALVLDDAEGEVTAAQTGIPVSWIAGAWLERAAIGGNAQAMYLLSDAYKNGWYGKPKQAELAEYWAAMAKKTETRADKPTAR